MIRRANINDLDSINSLLKQVLDVHHNGRPDVFKGGVKKYTDEELVELIKDDEKPIFVYEENGIVEGYCFCIFQKYINNNILTDIKTLYIDDLCVDEKSRGKHIGSKLFEFVKEFAQNSGCYNVTLNVWSLNENALRFYEKCGMKPQKIGMEIML